MNDNLRQDEGENDRWGMAVFGPQLQRALRQNRNPIANGDYRHRAVQRQVVNNRNLYILQNDVPNVTVNTLPFRQNADGSLVGYGRPHKVNPVYMRDLLVPDEFGIYTTLTGTQKAYGITEIVYTTP